MFTNTIASPAKRALEIITKFNLANDFYLAGGTGASLQLGHRISVDLDFFTGKSFDTESFSNLLFLSGIKISELEKSAGTVKFFLEGARISFFEYPYQLVVPPLAYDGIELAELIDIALMKIVAIANRGSKKDFVDLYMICKKYPLQELLDNFDKKFSKIFNKYQFIKALTYFADADKDPDPNMLIEWDWSKIKTFFIKSSTSIKFL